MSQAPTPQPTQLPPAPNAFKEGLKKTWATLTEAAQHAAKSGFWQTARLHIRRAFNWNLQSITPTETEVSMLGAAGITNPVLQRYFTWRRSLLMCVIGPLVLSALLATIDAIRTDKSGFTETGLTMEWLRVAALWAMPAAAGWALLIWTQADASLKRLVIGWAIGFLVPFTIAVIPIEELVKLDPALDALGILGTEQRANAVVTIRMLVAVTVFVQLLPSVLSLLPALVRSCVRVKTLSPGSVVAGWFLVGAGPLGALFWLVMFVAANAFLGGKLLIVGAALFISAPLWLVWNAKLFVRPAAPEALSAIGPKVKQAMTLMLSGIVVIVAFLFFDKVMGRTVIGLSAETSMIRPWNLDIYKFALDYLARSLFMTAIFSDLLVRISLAVHRDLQQFAGSPTSDDHNRAMDSLATQVNPLV